jgi:anhydro-N-acetylmuramic acid kinase
MPRLAIGLMSGTSADGVDAVLLESGTAGCRVLGHAHHPYRQPLRDALLRCGEEEHRISPRDLAELDAEVGEGQAEAAAALLDACPEARRAEVIGMHGQTVCHIPPRNSLQLGNPGPLLARLQIAVVCDLRRGDLALGGQGAPLVPPFHAEAFGAGAGWRVALNLGGIANVSWLPPREGGTLSGYDTGPGNGLLDAWHALHCGGAFDEDGAWAASGELLPELLEAWLAHPFFAQAPPKSTGRGSFRLESLFARAAPRSDARAEDVQRTLLELSARSVADALRKDGRAIEAVILCGGGARNGCLSRRLAELLAPVPLRHAEDYGIGADQVEAAAMAWLALRRLDGLPVTRASVTGAAADAVCGALHLPPRTGADRSAN